MDIIFISCVILFIIIIYVVVRKVKLSKKLGKLRDSWGKSPEKSLDIESVKIFFNLTNTNPINSCYSIDNDTWHDLNLDEIFSIINRTTTPTGAQYLFYLLRHPVLKKEILNDRENLINCFYNNQNIREQLQLTIQRLERDGVKYIPYSLWGPLPERPFYAQ